jgi:Bacteriophage HK97-gp10, putative tail-component
VSDVRVEVKGTDELARGARDLAGKVADAAGDVGRIVADQVAASARSSAPRLTGRLAASIAGRAEAETVSMSMGDGVPYAGWIEFGGTRGRPYVAEGRYLYGPAQARFDDYVRRLDAATQSEVRGYSWPKPT